MAISKHQGVELGFLDPPSPTHSWARTRGANPTSCAHGSYSFLPYRFEVKTGRPVKATGQSWGHGHLHFHKQGHPRGPHGSGTHVTQPCLGPALAGRPPLVSPPRPWLAWPSLPCTHICSMGDAALVGVSELHPSPRAHIPRGHTSRGEDTGDQEEEGADLRHAAGSL